jgi:hypothetical protein
MNQEPARQPDERLADYVDGRMTSREHERFVAELRVNPQLRADLADYERTVQSIRRALGAPTMPVPLATRVMAAIAQGAAAREVLAAPRRTHWRPLGWSLLSAAALLAVALGLDAWSRPAELHPVASAPVESPPTDLPANVSMAVGSAAPTGSVVAESAGPEVAAPRSNEFPVPAPGSAAAVEPAKDKRSAAVDGTPPSPGTKVRQAEVGSDTFGFGADRGETTGGADASKLAEQAAVAPAPAAVVTAAPGDSVVREESAPVPGGQAVEPGALAGREVATLGSPTELDVALPLPMLVFEGVVATPPGSGDGAGTAAGEPPAVATPARGSAGAPAARGGGAGSPPTPGAKAPAWRDGLLHFLQTGAGVLPAELASPKGSLRLRALAVAVASGAPEATGEGVPPANVFLLEGEPADVAGALVELNRFAASSAWRVSSGEWRLDPRLQPRPAGVASEAAPLAPTAGGPAAGAVPVAPAGRGPAGPASGGPASSGAPGVRRVVLQFRLQRR